MRRSSVIALMMVMIMFCCGEKVEKQELASWDRVIRDVGTFSSPRACDLNGDGIKDLVIGSGKVEMQPTDSAVLALDGVSGAILWQVHARDQMFGSAIFQDITGDHIQDVFIGGRSAEFLAINGKTGKIIWEFFPQGDQVDFTLHKLYNFYNPQLIRDIDEDGLDDILVANGGYVRAMPNDPDRPPGKLMLISSATGKLIAEAYMPDGKETYMSCILWDAADEEDPRVVFGTGGERLAGGLYVVRLSDIMKEDLSAAYKLAAGEGKGFIAPPVLADITGDGEADLVANAVDGRVIAIDGSDYSRLWELKLDGTEAYCSLAVGYFDDDDVPDFFTNFGIGVFPNLMRSYQLSVSGVDGHIISLDSIGTFHYGSPVAYDSDGDGRDEVFYHINESGTVLKNVLTLFDINDDSIYHFGPKWTGANIASTPLLDDLDNDSTMEIICIHENHPVDFFSLEYKTGLVVHKIKTTIPMNKQVAWGTYMGSSFNGIFN